MNFAETYKRAQQLLMENSPVILTAAGVTGTVTTAVLTGRGAFKAARVLGAMHDYQDNAEGFETSEDMPLQEKVKLTWKYYLPAIGVGTTTVTSIIFANRITSKRTAALAVAYGISDRAFQEYKEKVVERLGGNKETALRDEIAQDRVNRNPINNGREIIIAGGEVLCFDSITGRYFMSTIEGIKRAENKINHDMINHMYASLSSFYDEIGLPPTEYSNSVGWNTNNLLDITYSTTMSSDGRPCIVIDFTAAPVPNYGNLY